ncbi:hypothetical protein [Rhodococcus sp. (in: high G+C Gram-positive bacteria)]|uniref:hypothetical protein n=1 Tax=Rhodococcus sp. TaxID=1831 RepID=UPI00257B9976|nr:hypothetical protein [Rhodococcus sp. (in: high G+C Gram-positive bacteria)]
MQSKTRGSAEAKEWAAELAGRVGEEVRRLRADVHGMSAVQLANKTAELGYPITRGTIAKIESNSRAAKLDVAELLVLAQTLRVPPLQLLLTQAPLPNGRIEALPGREARGIDVAFWFTGEEFDFFEEALGLNRDDKEARVQASPIRSVRTYANARERYSTLMREAATGETAEEWKEQMRAEAAEVRRRLNELETMMREHGMTVDDE